MKLLDRDSKHSASTKNDYQQQYECASHGYPECLVVLLLVLLGLPEVFYGCFGVVHRLRHALLDFNQGLLLPVRLHVDIFGDLVDAAHYAMDFLQLVLPLGDDLGHVVCLHLDVDAARRLRLRLGVLTSLRSSWMTSSLLPHFPQHED
jgi:hypothetical protein